MALPPPPALPYEIVEEVLLRCPPDDPARLFRAALACKPWCRLVSDRRFRRRYREFHRARPMLGFIINLQEQTSEFTVGRFIPRSSFRPIGADQRGLLTLDARHGRVLLTNTPWGAKPEDNVLVVWNPFTDEQLVLPKLPLHPDPYQSPWMATVLCAAGSDCDHLDCHRGQFQVVFVLSSPVEMFSRVYLSEKGKWIRPIHGKRTHYDHLKLTPSLLVGGALYFMFKWDDTILKYDLATREMTLIDLPPPTTDDMGFYMLRTNEDGSLGVAAVEGTVLKQWSKGEGLVGDNGWTQSKVVDLKRLLPAYALGFIDVVACAEGSGVLFMRTPGGLFSVDPNSGCAMKIDVEGDPCFNIIPYMSFNLPGTALFSLGFDFSVLRMSNIFQLVRNCEYGLRFPT
jgi:hypothetical protein